MASTLLPPVVPYQLLGFVDVELEVVVVAPGCQSSDLSLLAMRPMTVVSVLEPCVTKQSCMNRGAEERAEYRALLDADVDTYCGGGDDAFRGQNPAVCVHVYMHVRVNWAVQL